MAAPHPPLAITETMQHQQTEEDSVHLPQHLEKYNIYSHYMLVTHRQHDYTSL